MAHLFLGLMYKSVPLDNPLAQEAKSENRQILIPLDRSVSHLYKPLAFAIGFLTAMIHKSSTTYCYYYNIRSRVTVAQFEYSRVTIVEILWDK